MGLYIGVGLYRGGGGGLYRKISLLTDRWLLSVELTACESIRLHLGGKFYSFPLRTKFHLFLICLLSF